jgi:hypothetical protein
MKIIK